MREVGAVEGLEDDMGFECPDTQGAQLKEVPRAPAPLVLGTEAVWAVEEVAGVNEGADSRADSWCLSPAMRVDCLSIVCARVSKAAEMSVIVYVVVEVE